MLTAIVNALQFGVVQFAQQQPHPLSFRSQVYRRGICLLPAAKQQIPRATLPRFEMTIP
jgi:hypothetical protein